MSSSKVERFEKVFFIKSARGPRNTGNNFPAVARGGVSHGVMKTSLRHLALCGLAVFGVGSGLAAPPDTTPASEFDLQRYQGIWHEQARFDIIFERGLTDITALYEILPDGTVRVTNSGTDAEGKRHSVTGRARVAESGNPADLLVSFIPPFTLFESSYRVLYVTPDYGGALVSDADGRYLWLLERSPKGTPEVTERLMQEAAKRGFDLTKLIDAEDE